MIGLTLLSACFTIFFHINVLPTTVLSAVPPTAYHTPISIPYAYNAYNTRPTLAYFLVGCHLGFSARASVGHDCWRFRGFAHSHKSMHFLERHVYL